MRPNLFSICASLFLLLSVTAAQAEDVTCREGIVDAARVLTHGLGMTFEQTLEAKDKLFSPRSNIPKTARSIVKKWRKKSYKPIRNTPSVFLRPKGEIAILMEKNKAPKKGAIRLIFLKGKGKGTAVDGNTLIALSTLMERAQSKGVTLLNIRRLFLPIKVRKTGKNSYIYTTPRAKITSEVQGTETVLSMDGKHGLNLGEQYVKLKKVCP